MKARLALLAAILLLLSACGSTASPSAKPGGSPASGSGASSSPQSQSQAQATSKGKAPFKVAFIEDSTPQKDGWVYADVRTADYIKQTIPGVQVTVVPSVPPGTPAVVPVLKKLIADGNQLIFADDFGYQNFVKQVAQANPKVTFVNEQATYLLPNMSSAYGKLEEGKYVAGVVAGLMTKTNVLGYVAAYKIPPVIIGINAFLLGARSVNPKAVVKVVWDGSWNDPPKATNAANALMNAGADVIANHLDTPATLEAAAARGKYGITGNGYFQNVAPKAFLTGTPFDWNHLFSGVVKAAMNHTFKPAFLRGDLADGTIKVLPYGPSVPQSVRQAANKAEQAIISNQLDIWKGPIYDTAGKLVVPPGKTLTQKQKDAMTWLVKGVESAG